MKEQLITLLETFGYPVQLQGTLNPNEAFPASFFTFWNDETDDGSHYDNHSIRTVWQFQVWFYSTDPYLVNTVTADAIKLLRGHGWIISGCGQDVRSGEITHTGRTFDAFYMEELKED